MRENVKTKLISYVELSLICLTLVVITVLHFRWLQAPHSYHSVLQFLYYLPVIHTSVRYGLKGGIIAALAATSAYALHMLGPLTMDDFINHILQIVLINIIGWVTGILSNSEKKIAQQHQNLVIQQTELIRKLEKSHNKLAEANSNLAREIAERQVLEERVRRSERLSALGHLAAGVAHEIRNPLGIIRATMQIIENEHKDNPSIQECSVIIVEECDRMNAVIEEFLQFARPAEPKFEVVLLSDILEEVMLFTNKYISCRGIQFFNQISSDLQPLNADSGQLKQVLINLIINAVDAMPGGGSLMISAYKLDHTQQIIVEDTGSGISNESISQIFDPFYSTKPTGTGLGLSIVYRILENHGGAIRVESNLENGTKFIISLPEIGNRNE
jgi:two-component system, NtrC family, sensor histidine kinase HydH